MLYRFWEFCHNQLFYQVLIIILLYIFSLQHNELMYHGIRLWTPSDLYKLMYEKEVDVSQRLGEREGGREGGRERGRGGERRSA